jgi:DNA-binding MarR family transcriptional regulator
MVDEMTSEIDFGILLGLSYQAFVDELRAALHAKGFTDLGPSYGYVFRALGAEALHLRALAGRLGMTDQGAGKIVDEMEARGYLERHADPDDGRIKRLRLATRGRAALAAARRFHRLYERRLAERLGPRQVAITRRILEAVGAGSDTAAVNLRPLL